MLIAQTRGHYHFLPGIDPYSCGVIADPGYEIIRAVLSRDLPWHEGMQWIDAYLNSAGSKRDMLCAVELRSPVPFTMQGFIDFNREYCAVLEDWDLYAGGFNPVARTHVAPLYDPPQTPALHAFSYVVPSPDIQRKTLVVAGAGELVDGKLVETGIIRRGDTSPKSMHEKAAYVMRVMHQRLFSLGADWDLVHDVNIYTAYPINGILEEIVWPAIGPARRWGTRSHPVRPPIVDIDFEMDMRGVVTNLVLPC